MLIRRIAPGLPGIMGKNKSRKAHLLSCSVIIAYSIAYSASASGIGAISTVLSPLIFLKLVFDVGKNLML